MSTAQSWSLHTTMYIMQSSSSLTEYGRLLAAEVLLDEHIYVIAHHVRRLRAQ